MLEHLSYILFFGILITLCVYFYIHLKYGFWVIQPVFHIYNINYMFNPPGIIDENLPIKNKYTNFTDIDTIQYSLLTSIQKKQFVNLIKYNYLQNKDNIYMPNAEHIHPYFIGHNEPCFISFFNKEQLLIYTKTNNLVSDKKIVGAITSRPLEILFNTKHKKPIIKAYYVDYLCVDKLHRKKNIAPQLIQTHHYNQRYNNKNIVVSLFKREDELTGIVPLCVYTTYGFPVNTWTKPYDLSAEYSIIDINQSNFRFLHDFVIENHLMFDIVIKPSMSNLLELIKTKNIFVTSILCDEQIICCYFFRKSCVKIENDLEVLSLFASINNCENDIFIRGFKISFWKIASENLFGYCAIEDISHNNIIIENIKEKTKPEIISPTAYFFYNFAYPTFKANKTLIIN